MNTPKRLRDRLVARAISGLTYYPEVLFLEDINIQGGFSILRLANGNQAQLLMKRLEFAHSASHSNLQTGGCSILIRNPRDIEKEFGEHIRLSPLTKQFLRNYEFAMGEKAPYEGNSAISTVM